MTSGKSPLDQALAIVRDKLDSHTAKIIEAAITDANRLAVIRDAFLEGRDVEAVQQLRDLDPIGIRKVLGFDSGTFIVPAQTVSLTARPQLPFRGTHVAVSPACAAYFQIDDISIRNQSQFLEAGSVAADLFAADIDELLASESDREGAPTLRIDRVSKARFGLPIDMPECLPGQTITLRVTHLGEIGPDHGTCFRAAILGTTRQL